LDSRTWIAERALVEIAEKRNYWMDLT
jgi:hypothetical protein